MVVKRIVWLGAGLAAAAVVIASAFSAAQAQQKVQLSPMATAMKASFPPSTGKPIESPDNPITQEKVDLGRMLYYDTRFSKNQDLSCNSCHQLDKYGVDNLPTSPGHKKQLGGRNSPTVYHAAGQYAQFWDARAKTVEEQALGPVLNPIEMAMPSEDHVLKVLKSIPQYVELFKKAFPGEADPVTYANFGKAIGAFERGLVTISPWDKFAAGDDSALTDAQKAGFNAFIESLCFSCHMGTNFGGTIPNKTGLVHAWPSQKDLGRYEVTKNDAEKMFFKVPVLRNIDKTGPYFHDGSVASLEEAVKLMAWHQSGIKLTDEKAKSIVDFLGALTGELPADYIKKPELPPSTDSTPKPDPN